MADRGPHFECVVNISEGRDQTAIDLIGGAGGEALLDVHADPDHHRAVLTLAGTLETVEASARRVATAAVTQIDIRTHVGVHPRLGAIDVVPFVPLTVIEEDRAAALGARNRFAGWAAEQLALPCFLYGPERSLPEVRRLAFRSLAPDRGPGAPHPTAGAAAVGTRPVLVAYNVWITDDTSGDRAAGGPHALSVARGLAAGLRGPAVRALGLRVATGAQVSVNLLDPRGASIVGVYDTVAAGAESQGCSVVRAELVGLLPAEVLGAVPRHRWAELDLDDARTIEGRWRCSR